MENHNQHKHKEEKVIPVSRKTNEEIDEDENGNLIIGGKISTDDLSGKYSSEDKSSRKDNLANTNEARED